MPTREQQERWVPIIRGADFTRATRGTIVETIDQAAILVKPGMGAELFAALVDRNRPRPRTEGRAADGNIVAFSVSPIEISPVGDEFRAVQTISENRLGQAIINTILIRKGDIIIRLRHAWFPPQAQENREQTERFVQMVNQLVNRAAIVTSQSPSSSLSAQPAVAPAASVTSAFRATRSAGPSAPRAALLSINDLPRGWRLGSPENAILDLANYRDQIGRLNWEIAGSEFQYETASALEAIDQTIVVLGRGEGRSALQTLAKAYQPGVDQQQRDSDGYVLRAAIAPLPFPSFGDESYAFQVKSEYEISKVNGLTNVVFLRRGDTIVRIRHTKVSLNEPILDTKLTESITRRADELLTAAIMTP